MLNLKLKTTKLTNKYSQYGRDHMVHVVGFKTTYAISAYHH
jgi:hypothetical protein